MKEFRVVTRNAFAPFYTVMFAGARRACVRFICGRCLCGSIAGKRKGAEMSRWRRKRILSTLKLYEELRGGQRTRTAFQRWAIRTGWRWRIRPRRLTDWLWRGIKAILRDWILGALEALGDMIRWVLAGACFGLGLWCLVWIIKQLR